jgi:hypothetical protein
VSRAELPPSQGPLITQVVGCLVWWPLAALACVVIFPGQGGFGVAAAGAGLLALRLAHLIWGVAATSAGRSEPPRSDARALARGPVSTPR